MGTHYLWNPINDNIVKEFDNTGSTIADYTTEPYLHGDVISQHRNGESRFYHFDGQGNTTSLTDVNGNVTDTLAYNAFGEVTERTGSTLNPFQYGGQKGYYRDPETGDLIVRRRPLSAAEGMWRSPDPAGVAEDPNLYRYAANNPISRFDPSGLKCAGYAGPFSPTFAKETWFARIEADGCGKKEGEEGAYKVILTFWAYDSVNKVCNDEAAAFIRRHRLNALAWQYRGGESKCETSPIEVRYRDDYTPPAGDKKQPFHDCMSVTFVFQCPVICSGDTCRPFPLPNGKGKVCVGSTAGNKCALVEWSLSFPEGDACNRCPPCEDKGASVKLGEDDFIVIA